MKKNLSYKVFTSVLFLFGLSFLLSCSSSKDNDASRFKTGVFEIPAGKGYSKTIVKRIDSLQIEEYTKFTEISTDSGVYKKESTIIDTLFIKWKNNFFYTLKMKSPKTDLDKDPIFVQINKITENSYDFTAKIGFSEFKQKGTFYKIK
ncbi:hypothetical protein N9W35_04755 [Flavobacteriaceae bacterium]|nr:hypothetical protein [Flavobacteriaceae bacterium]MDB2420239.1 hypothetical protein [Flavobacteriaceae bacterium]